VAWIIYGITMLALETKCTTSDTFYLGVLGFISAFMIGTVVFFIIFVVTLISLRNPSQEDEEKTDIKSRLVV
jgi:membrane protein implicated in regulation of membrane protease activity